MKIEQTLGRLNGGELLREIDNALAEVVQAVDATGKVGKVTIATLRS